ISELLGLPDADRPTFIGWANEMAQFSGMFTFLRMMGTIRKMRRYFQERLKEAREKGGDGLVAELVRVESEGGRVSAGELVSMLVLLVAAGSQTTAHLISGAAFELFRDPDRRDWLEQDWSRSALAVEEFLRFVSPVQFSKPRIVRRDVELDGVRLRKGD